MAGFRPYSEIIGNLLDFQNLALVGKGDYQRYDPENRKQVAGVMGACNLESKKVACFRYHQG